MTHKELTQQPQGGGLGLVLSGGGAKGAYQAGVLRALTEEGVVATHVAGASIGALNGALVAAAPTQQAAVEQVFVNVNPAATLMLGQARGVAVAALVLRGLSVYEYTALQVKQAVVGQGKAAKEQVQHMVVQMLKLSGKPQADAADGLAVALTHALRNHSLAAKLHNASQIKSGQFQV